MCSRYSAGLSNHGKLTRSIPMAMGMMKLMIWRFNGSMKTLRPVEDAVPSSKKRVAATWPNVYGYRFCYGCGGAAGTCGCNSPNHRSLNEREYVADAPVRDDDGRVDLRSCILRRTLRADRKERRANNAYEEQEGWTYYIQKKKLEISLSMVGGSSLQRRWQEA